MILRLSLWLSLICLCTFLLQAVDSGKFHSTDSVGIPVEEVLGGKFRGYQDLPNVAVNDDASKNFYHTEGAVRNGLNKSVRKFKPENLAGAYQVEEANPGCPRILKFENALTQSGVSSEGLKFELYPMSSALYNNSRCGNGHILLIRSSDLPASVKGPGSTIGILANKTDFLLVYNSQTALCGSSLYQKGLSLAFLDSAALFLQGGIKVPARRKLLVYGETNGSCAQQSLLGEEVDNVDAFSDAEDSSGTKGDSSSRARRVSRAKGIGIGVGTFLGTIVVAVLFAGVVVFVRRRRNARLPVFPDDPNDEGVSVSSDEDSVDEDT